LIERRFTKQPPTEASDGESIGVVLGALKQSVNVRFCDAQKNLGLKCMVLIVMFDQLVLKTMSKL